MHKRVITAVLFFLFIVNMNSFGNIVVPAVPDTTVKIRIKGNVIDEFGYVVKGAKVYVKDDTDNFTYTDEKGNFIITVKNENETLVFVHEGHIRELVKVGRKREINIELKIDRKKKYNFERTGSRIKSRQTG